MTKQEFKEKYTEKLIAAIKRNPDQYMDTPETAHRTVEKMVAVIEERGATSVNLGPALKATLRAFKLPTTYKGLEQARNFWGQG